MSVQEKNSENSSQHIRDAEPHNFAPSPDFKWLCDELYVKLDALLENRHKLGKSYSVSCLEVIIHFIKLWRKTVGNDFYEVFLLTFPYRDPRSYNIKDFTLIKAVCRYLNLPRNSLTENRLLSWKRLATRGKKLSAFCVEEIKKRRKEPEKSTRLTIESLNQKLSELSKESSTKKWGFNGLSQSAVFRFCLQNMTFVEMPYFFDILLKTRVVGGLEHKFLHCWHPDALDYLGVVSDLKLLSLKLWNAQERLGKTDLTINIGRAFSPQLARRMASSYESICRRLSGNFFVEEKMDGERIQVHYMQFGSSLKFFSRRGTDYTHLYGSSISSGVISRHVKLSPDVENCVLDGEMVTYDREKQTVLPFGIVKSSAVDEMISHEAGIDGKGFRPFFMIFDLLFLNGVSLTKVPLETRQEYLQTVINPVPNIIEVLKSLKCSDSNDIRNLLEKAISMGSEGIVLKQCSSIYSIGARNEAWIKVKPEYLEQFGENLDLIVIGRDPGKKDSFMCGLALLENDDEKDIKEVIELSGDDEGNLPEQIVETTERKFISFCSIANGISDEECKDIDRKTRGKWVKTSERLPPPELIEFGSKLPAEWIDPRESLVMEVKARSVNNSESAGVKFRSGSTLYGGYCRRIRDDKDWKSCATFRQYFQAKLSHNHMRYRRRIHNVSPRKKKRSSSAKMELLYGGLDTTQIQSHTEIFQGKRFYVLSDYTSVTDKTRVSYDRIISLVLHNGGSMVYNLDLRDGELQFLYIIGSKLTIECKALIERGYDIISPLWLFDSVRSQSALKLEPKHCFRVSKELLENAYSRVDKFGDSYESVMTGTEFDHKLISWNDKEITRKLKEACQDELMEIPIFLFYAFSAIVVNLNSGNQTVRQAADLFELFGGKITDDWLRANVIIVPSEEVDQTEMRSLREKAIKATRSRNETNLRLPHIVKLEWITACIEENCLVAEEETPLSQHQITRTIMAGHYDGFVPIHCIFYSVFHPTEGTKVRYEFPPGCIAASGINFDTIKNYIIPKPQLCNKLLTFKYGSYRLVCYPVNVVAPFYARNSFNFNFVFVFPYECATTPYEPAIARLGKMFRVLEEQSQILSKAELDQVYYHLKSDDAKGDQNNGMDMPDEKDRLKDSLGSVKPKDKTYIFEKYQEIISDLNKSDRKLSVKDLITKIYQDLNNYSECLIPIDSGNSVDTKLFPLLTPPNSCFSFEDVPIATVNLSKLIDVNWDPTMLKIIPYINGINSISKIAHCSDSNVELVIECVKHLIYYHCVVLVDIFQFSNIYAPTSDLEKFLSDPSVASACQAYVSFPDNSPINDLPFTRKPQASMKKQNQSSISIDSSRRKSVSSRAGSMSSDADSLDLKHRSLSSRGSSVPLASVSDASLSSSNRFKPNGREYATKSSLFDLYRSFQQGQTVKDWYALNYEKIKLGNVDVRRLISFGLIHGLIYRCYAYPITKSMSFLGIAKALNSLDDFKETKGQQHRRPHKLNVLSTADIQVGIEHDKRGELRLLGKHKSNSQLADEVLQEVYRKLAPNKLLAGGINSESTISLATDDTGSRDTTFRKEKSDPTLLNRGNKVAFDIKERSPLSQIQMEGFHRNELSVLRPRKREEFVLLQSLKQAESLDKICTRLDKDRKAVTGMIKDLGSYHIVNC